MGAASNRLLNIPDEGSQALCLSLYVKGMESFEEVGYFLVFEDDKDGGVERRPCVAAEMRLAGVASAT